MGEGLHSCIEKRSKKANIVDENVAIASKLLILFQVDTQGASFASGQRSLEFIEGYFM